MADDQGEMESGAPARRAGTDGDRPHCEADEWLVVPGVLDSWATVRATLESHCGVRAVDEAAVSDLLLAVSEAMSNAVLHGTCFDDRTIEVGIRLDHQAGAVTLLYPGEPFALVEPSLPPTFSTKGRGRYLMNLLCDEVTYHFDGGVTRLNMRKVWG